MKSLYLTVSMICVTLLLASQGFSQSIALPSSPTKIYTDSPAQSSVTAEGLPQAAWFTITLPQSGSLQVTANPYDTIDLKISIYYKYDTREELVLIGSVNQYGLAAAESTVLQELQAGIYYIAVESVQYTGSFVIEAKFTQKNLSAAPFMLHDFNNYSNYNNLGGSSSKIKDTEYGVSSTVDLYYSSVNDDIFLEIDYTLIPPTNGSTFVGFRTFLQEDNSPIDLSGTAGFSFLYSGEAAEFHVITPTTGSEPHFVSIPKSEVWTRFVVTWDDLNASAHDTITKTEIEELRWILASSDTITSIYNLDKIELLGYELPAEPTYCDTSIATSLGTNTFTASEEMEVLYNWYKYTPTNTKTLHINLGAALALSDIYSDCYSSPIEYTNTNGILSLPVEANKTIYFKLYNTEYDANSYPFTIYESEILYGSFCSYALYAYDSINTTTTSNSKAWYKYIAPQDGIYKISSCGLTQETTELSIYNSCNSYPILQADNNCNNQAYIYTQLSASDTIYIQWHTIKDSVSFNWEITRYNEDALIADFSTYTDGNLQSGVSFYNNSLNADRYEWNFGDGNTSTEIEPIHNYAYEGLYTIQLISYKTLVDSTEISDTLIKKHALFIKPKDSPRTCQEDTTTRIATEGDNYLYITNGAYQWFAYTAQANGTIDILTNYANNQTNVDLNSVYEECENEVQFDDYITGISYSFTATKNTTYYIELFVKNYMQSDTSALFTILEHPIVAGIDCESPIYITNDSISFTMDSGTQNTYYRYIAAEDGVIEINTCNNNWSPNVYNYVKINAFSSCDNEYDFKEHISIKCSDNYNISVNSEVIKVASGDTVNLRLDYNTPQNFTWDFAFRNFYEGETCYNPIEVAENDTNRMPTHLTSAFYTYTAPADGVIKIHNCDYVNPQETQYYSKVKIFQNCEENTTILHQEARNNCTEEQGVETYSEVKQGETYLIYINTNSVLWNFEFDEDGELPEGYACSSPLQLHENEPKTVNTQEVLTWFETEFEQSGTATISIDNINSEYSIFIFDECSNLTTPLTHSVEYIREYNSNYITFWPQAEKTYKILLAIENPAHESSYSITSSYVSGAAKPSYISCSDAEEIEQGEIQTTTNYGQHWYVYEGTQNSILEISYDQSKFNRYGYVAPQVFDNCSGTPYIVQNQNNHNSNNNTIQYYTIEETKPIYIQIQGGTEDVSVNWNIKEHSANLADIIYFSIEESLSTTIDSAEKTIQVILPKSYTNSSINLEYKFSAGATAQLLAEEEKYELYSSTFTYLLPTDSTFNIRVLSASGQDSSIWKVEVVKNNELSNKAEVIGITYYNNIEYTIDTTNASVDITVPYFSNEQYYLTIQLSPMATTDVNNNMFSIGSTSFTVYAEDGTEKQWTITITKNAPSAGATCSALINLQEGRQFIKFEEGQEVIYGYYIAKHNGSVQATINGADVLSLWVLQDCANNSYDNENTEYFINNYNYNYSAKNHVNQFDTIEYAIVGNPSAGFTFAHITIEETPNIITSFEVANVQSEYYVGDTVALYIDVYPSQNYITNITATVNPEELESLGGFYYKVLKEGKHTIQFSTTDGSELYDSIIILGVLPFVSVYSVAIENNNMDLELHVGDYHQFTTEVLPLNATDKSIIWTSTDTLTVKISTDGQVQALREGSSIITATSLENPQYYDEITVTVVPIAIESIVLNRTSIHLTEGDVFTKLTATALPTNSSGYELLWYIQDTSIAKLDNNNIVAVAAGSTQIIVNDYYSQLYATATIEVVALSTTDASKLILAVNESKAFVESLEKHNLIGNSHGQYPSQYSDSLTIFYTIGQNVLDDITNYSQRQIDSTEQLVLHYYTVLKNSKINKVDIASILIKNTESKIQIGQGLQLFVEILPTNATNKDLRFYSSNEGVAIVSARGAIKTLKPGTAYIYAASQDGSRAKDSIKITVYSPIEQLQLPRLLSLQVGDSIQVAPTVIPLTGAYESYSWQAEDTSIATVNENGRVLAKKPGATTLSVYESLTGLVATTVVYVQESTIAVEGIHISPDTLRITIGSYASIQTTITPYNATNQQYTLSSSRSSLIIPANNSGIIYAAHTESGYVTAKAVDGGYTDSVYVQVLQSQEPIMEDLELSINADNSSYSVALEEYIHDDNSNFNELIIEAFGTDRISASVLNGILHIEALESENYNDTISIKITDIDGNSIIKHIPITIDATQPTAPEFKEDPWVSYENTGYFIPINVWELLEDLNLPHTEISFEVKDQFTNLLGTMGIDGMLYFSKLFDDWTGTDSIQVQVQHTNGEFTTEYIKITISENSNTAPQISDIPTQNYSEANNAFPILHLKQYVKDDYTSPAHIAWEVSPNSRLKVNIKNGVATITPADNNWIGTTTITFTAYDEEGLADSKVVEFTKASAPFTNWMVAPNISFAASQTVVGIQTPVQFSSSLSGATSWIWEFDGVQVPINQRSAVNPVIHYTKGGQYTVTLKAQNEYGIESLIKTEYITVLGINRTDTIVCAGSTVTLQSTVSALGGYSFEWSTGEITEEITVSPTETTTYTLLISKGLFVFEDNITLFVPRTVELPQQKTALCENEELQVEANGFALYNWNNSGWTQDNSTIINSIGTTTLQVEDEYGCISADSITISQIHSLPQITLADKEEVCLHSSTELAPQINNGVAPYKYNWNTGDTSSHITVDTEGAYTVQVTDNNTCSSTAQVNVEILRPHQEEIGVATFAKDEDGIIIAWQRTLGKRTESYEVFRETGATDNYISIGTLPFNAPESIIVDYDADALTKSYRYKLVTKDSVCGNTAESTPHATVVAIYDISQITGKGALQWSKYEGLPIATYRILKQTNNSLIKQNVEIAEFVQVDSVA